MKNEEQIIKSCIKGESLAWKYLYAHYAPLIKATALRYERDANKVSDLLQEVFIKIHANLKKFNFDGSFEGWVRRITVNVCIDYVKKIKKLGENFDETILEIADYEEFDDQSIIKILIDAGTSKDSLIELINGLPVNYATVFNLCFIDDWSHKDIADKLQITESLSRKWAFRARTQLKNQLLQQIKI